MNYQTIEYNKSDFDNQQTTINCENIINKKKYQKYENNNLDILKNKIEELDKRVNFLKKNLSNCSNLNINSKIMFTINNIDSIIDDINFEIIKNAKINIGKKIIMENE